jgi:hypothetical protein
MCQEKSGNPDEHSSEAKARSPVTEYIGRLLLKFILNVA